MRKTLIPLLAAAACALPAAPTAAWAQKVTKLVPGSAFHGVHGIRFAPDGQLYAGSVIGQTLYSVNAQTGEWRVVEPPPWGEADDIAFGPDGQVVWTAILAGTVYTKRGKGPAEVLAKDLPGANSVVFSPDKKHLYLGQVFLGDAVWELDATGAKPPRRIANAVGGFNSFDVGPDGALYGPLWFKSQIGRIDPNTGAVTVVAEGFKTPAAAKFGPDGKLYAIDTAVGVLYRVDIATGAKTKVAQLTPALDNMAFDGKGRLFVSNMSDNGIQQVDLKSGKLRQVIKGALAYPADIAISTADGKDTLFVADAFAYRSVDGQSGKVTTLARAYSDDIANPSAVGVAGDKVLLVGGGSIDVRDRLTGKRLSISEPFAGPTDVVGLPNGDWLVSQEGGEIIRVSGATRTTLAKGLKAPVSLALGPDAVFVAERDGGKITRIDLATGAASVAADGFGKPRAVALTAAGDLVVLDVGAKQVVWVGKGGERRVLARELPVGYLPDAPGGGIAVGAKGDVYLSSDVENAIYKISGIGR
ncbi:SMP-30/gluconolactonase/LRE family protein [uncultured Phenylobacterium sp.]|uniref:SMP-30/gluconolactonase/LRE family protein n=1 Tax=uncultured Phenylobacterium sp. TaxID=349273 RepID=UPI0025E2F2FD|nr:SMP-30/gluconolactonase/LRE family protein [uncultured Phenylobacterium sp.]